MRVFIIYCFSWLLLFGHAMANSEKNIYGYVEKATLVDKDLTLSAKLDTGAKSASLNATNIQKIEVDGKPYLRFVVPSKEGDVVFESEYIGDVNIKTRALEAKAPALVKKSITRPMVLMRIKMADKERTIRVNLTNRKRFIYPLLLGREAIVAFDGIIDPDLQYTVTTNKTDNQ